MNQKEMLEALTRRDENVLTDISARYGPYIRKIAFGILHSEADTEEVENDVWLKLWRESESGPPTDIKKALGLYARQIAVDKLRTISAARRGGGEYTLALDELTEAIPDSSREDPADRLALKEAMSRFLSSLSKRNRQLFLCRYWYAMSVKECSAAFGLSESGVKTMLHRLRSKLKAQLEKEEIIV